MSRITSELHQFNEKYLILIWNACYENLFLQNWNSATTAVSKDVCMARYFSMQKVSKVGYRLPMDCQWRTGRELFFATLLAHVACFRLVYCTSIEYRGTSVNLNMAFAAYNNTCDCTCYLLSIFIDDKDRLKYLECLGNLVSWT
jgi:hypothetical protein